MNYQIRLLDKDLKPISLLDPIAEVQHRSLADVLVIGLTISRPYGYYYEYVELISGGTRLSLQSVLPEA